MPIKQNAKLVLCWQKAMYRQQQNKWYPQRCLLAHFEATLDFSHIELTST